jgi:hypothetical protein
MNVLAIILLNRKKKTIMAKYKSNLSVVASINLRTNALAFSFAPLVKKRCIKSVVMTNSK